MGTSWDAVKCVPVMGADGPGSPCNDFGNGLDGNDSCAAGSLCMLFGNNARCVELCGCSNNRVMCNQPGTACAVFNGGKLPVCHEICDPLDPDCGAGSVCIFQSDTFICAIDGSGSQGQDGDACLFANACKSGLFCIDAAYLPTCGSAGCCTPTCDVANPGACPGAGEQCLTYFLEPPDACWDDVGFCGVA